LTVLTEPHACGILLPSIHDSRLPAMRIEIRQGDITAQPDVDAIVNAANTDLALGAGVAGAIRRKGGDEIDREARALGPIPLGEAVATSAGRLPNQFVIHAAAMGYRAEDQRVPKRPGSMSSAAIIGDATRNSLLRAEERKLASIAFPALATGVAAFPVEECAEAMIGAVREFAAAHPESSVQRVVFVLYGAAEYEVFRRYAERTK
jgi:O-acetyl-ADP-ribose deacetylase (regulator of RNase III)